MPVKVKLLNPHLKARYGETLHVSDHIVEGGVLRGLWEVIETKEMAPAEGMKYETKVSDALSSSEVYGPKTK